MEINLVYVVLMNLIIEAVRSSDDGSYSITIKVTGIRDAETCERLSAPLATSIEAAFQGIGLAIGQQTKH